jgi:hypothetical protein
MFFLNIVTTELSQNMTEGTFSRDVPNIKPYIRATLIQNILIPHVTGCTYRTSNGIANREASLSTELHNTIKYECHHT